ncbi:MAG: hypothetical protein RMJ43_15850 [Chloroherpetonaceae bacterium]|nr:hypothetical protein [Chthonomonadaceae bacterium]MDW8209308.1 hypothetical protein [Chloroherpetonaceae bacterium]
MSRKSLEENRKVAGVQVENAIERSDTFFDAIEAKVDTGNATPGLSNNTETAPGH